MPTETKMRGLSIPRQLALEVVGEPRAVAGMVQQTVDVIETSLRNCVVAELCADISKPLFDDRCGKLTAFQLSQP